MKTLEQLMNDVGKHLRLSDGTTYTAVNQDADAIFIVSCINIAKDMVEGEAQWEAMFVDITFDSVVSTQTYDTSDLAVVTSDPDVTNERSQIVTGPTGHLQMWDVTTSDEFRMTRRTRSWVKHHRATNGATSQSKPGQVAIYPFGSGLTVEFPFDVSEIRSYLMQVYTPQVELTATTDTLECPWRPVVLAATALAAEERGEELGMDASSWWERYNSALSQALVVNMFSAEDATLIAT